jgi:general secretion pathway protein G
MSGIFRSKHGFTMIEILVVMGIIAVLAAVMTPAIVNHIKESKVTRATHDVQLIAGSVAAFYKDTGRWPTDNDKDHSPADQEVELLKTNLGVMPGEENGKLGWTNFKTKDTFENQLTLNEPGGKSKNAYPTTGETGWDGPYQNTFKADPWGNYFLCNVEPFHPGKSGAVWVISAGPDGILQTYTTDTSVRGDDLGFLLTR